MADVTRVSVPGPRLRVALLVAALLAAALLAAGGSAQGASSSVTVSMVVPSATYLDATGCATGTTDVTAMGVVLPGSARVTGTEGGAPCRLVFGSSNDTARLEAFQSDRQSNAMHGFPTGALDTSFNTTGVLEHSTPGGSYFAYGARYDGDRFVVVTDAGSPEAYLDRRMLDGTLDTSFGGGTGRLALHTGQGHNNTRYRDVIVDSAGRIIAVGADTGLFDAFLCRVTAAGAHDTTVVGGLGCMKLMVAGSTLTRFNSIIQHPAGGYLAAGTTVLSSVHKAFVVRLAEDGSVDTAWGSSGYWIQPGSAPSVFIGSIAVQSSGRIVVAANENRTTRDAVIYGVTADGATDTSFGSSGSAALDSGTGDDVLAVQVGGDDRVTFAWRSGTQLYLSRLLPGGALDSGFNGGARYASPVPAANDSEMTIGLTVGATGTVFASYTGSDLVATPWVHVQLRADGTPDTRFAGDGVLEDGSTAGDADRVSDHVELHDGTIMALGRTSTPLTRLLRFQTARIAQYDDAAGRDWSAASTDLFGACMQATSGTALAVDTWQPDAFGVADCLDGDSDPWQAIARYPGDTDSGAKSVVARSSGTGQVASEVLLRFGMRASASTPAGQYVAPLTFQVAAPG